MKIKKKWTSVDVQTFSMAMFSVVFLLVFSYIPMCGILLAFKDADKKLDIMNVLIHGEWVQLDNFKKFLTDPDFSDVFFNTVGLNLLMLLFNFPAPIIFALLINEVKNEKFARSIQTITTFPHFISWIVFGGIVIALTDMTTGIANPLLEAVGLSSPENPVNLGRAEYFWTEMIVSSILKGVGWGSIVYISAIAAVDKSMYEAAELDGANRMQKALFVTLPAIVPTIIVFLLLNISRLLVYILPNLYSVYNMIRLY